MQILLPFRNRNQGEIARAQARVRLAQASLQQTELVIRADVEAATDNYRREQQMVQQTLPQMRERARKNLDILTEAYRIGGVDLLRYIDAERTEIRRRDRCIARLRRLPAERASTPACLRRPAMRLRARGALTLLALVCLCGCSKSDRQDAAKQPSATSGGASQPASQDPGTVKIDPADQQRAGIAIAPVEVRAMPQFLTVTGQVQMDEQHTSHIGALADGLITAVYVLPGATVHRGALLAQIHSHTVHETVGALVQAYAAADRQRGAIAFAQQAVQRYAHLYSIQAASLEEKQRADQALLQANQDLADAQASVHMEREHLSELLQVSPESLTANHLYDKELVPIRSPIDGVVISRMVTVGQVLSTGGEAFTVSNLSTVWVTAAVNEKDLSLLHHGASVDVTIQGYPNTAFHGRVAMIGDTVDPQTRTIPVRIVVLNPATQLRPGMFATASIAGTQTRTAIFVPEDALQDINGNQVVFVTADGVALRAQVVKLGVRSLGRVEVLDGVKPNDRVVVRGAFMVKGELLKGTMGDG